MKKNFDKQEISLWGVVVGLNYIAYAGGEQEFWEFEIDITDTHPSVNKYVTDRNIRLRRPYSHEYSCMQLYGVAIGDTVSVVYGNSNGGWNPERFYKP